MRTEVPGGWVELRDPDEVPERLQRPVRYASMQLGRFPNMRRSAELQAQGLPRPDELLDAIALEMADGAMEALDTLTRLQIVARVAAWSFGDVSEAVLDDLPTKTYRAVAALVDAAEPVAENLADPSGDPDSPTPPSTD